MYKDIVVDAMNINSSCTALQNNSDHNDADQQPASKNVTTDSDPELECDATQN